MTNVPVSGGGRQNIPPQLCESCGRPTGERVPSPWQEAGVTGGPLWVCRPCHVRLQGQVDNFSRVQAGLPPFPPPATPTARDDRDALQQAIRTVYRRIGRRKETHKAAVAAQLQIDVWTLRRRQGATPWSTLVDQALADMN